MIGSGDQLPGSRPAGFELAARSIAPATASHGGDLRQTPTAISDPILPLINLSSVFQKMDSLRRFLSDSVNSNASINEDQIQFVSSEISSAVHHIILNGAALIASSHPPIMNPDPKGSQRDLVAPISPSDLRPTASMDPLGSGVFPNGRDPADPKGSYHGRRSDLPSKPIQSQIAGKVANPVAPICGRDPADSLFYVNPDPKGSQPSSSIFLRDLAAPISKKKSDLSLDPGLTAVMDPSGSLFSAKTSEDRDPADPKGSRHGLGSDLSDPMAEDEEIVEIDAIELMADHVHLCEICGKGFKRDANLRMHMRAHGNQFKTLEALSKPDSDLPSIRTRFSCPFAGCSRNRAHKRFQPLKSAACVKNHFKRSHCPKLYSCNRCREKRFAVVADLKSHLKHCGEKRWRCSCGTSFSRKDKLFGHVVLFEGHSPAVVDESGGPGGKAFGEGLDDEFFEGLAEEIGGIGGVFG